MTDEKPFDKPVTLELGRVGRYRRIHNTREAAECLMTVWPLNRGARHRDAVETCLKVLEGYRSTTQQYGDVMFIIYLSDYVLLPLLDGEVRDLLLEVRVLLGVDVLLHSEASFEEAVSQAAQGGERRSMVAQLPKDLALLVETFRALRAACVEAGAESRARYHGWNLRR